MCKGHALAGMSRSAGVIAWPSTATQKNIMKQRLLLTCVTFNTDRKSVGLRLQNTRNSPVIALVLWVSMGDDDYLSQIIH